MEDDAICRQHGQRYVAICYLSTATAGQNPDIPACPDCLRSMAAISAIRLLVVEPMDAVHPWTPDGVSASDLYRAYGNRSNSAFAPQVLLQLLGD